MTVRLSKSHLFVPTREFGIGSENSAGRLCQDLCRDIYDLYAEYEEEEVQDQFPVSPRLLRSPAKHLNLNINVGGTVSSFTGSPDRLL